MGNCGASHAAFFVKTPFFCCLGNGLFQNARLSKLFDLAFPNLIFQLKVRVSAGAAITGVR
jgi:hypothetical protein